MDIKEVAAALNGCEYNEEGSKELFAAAAAAGIVIVFGASDDLMEFRGAVTDEVGCYDGGKAYFTEGGLLENKCEEEDCPYFGEAKDKAAVVEAVRGEDGYSWTYKTDIPHETFEVFDDGDKYCRGIVFHLHQAYKRSA